MAPGFTQSQHGNKTYITLGNQYLTIFNDDKARSTDKTIGLQKKHFQFKIKLNALKSLEQDDKISE